MEGGRKNRSIHMGLGDRGINTNERKGTPERGGEGRSVQPAATLISLNFPSLIRDLQPNPSLQEAICFTLSQLPSLEASLWVGLAVPGAA